MLTMLIVVAIVMSLEHPIIDLLGSFLGYLVELFTALIHCIFSWGIEHLTQAFVIGQDMYEDEFVLSILNYGKGVMVRIGIVMLVIIAMWQISKTFLAFAGLNGEIEEPWKIGIKIFIFVALVRGSYGLCEFIVTGPVDKAVNMMLSIETKAEEGSIRKVIQSGNSLAKNKKLYVADNIGTVLSKDMKTGLFFALVKFIIIVVIDYKIFMFMLSLLQKYVNMIIYILLSPAVFACGVSRSTSYVLKSWIKLFVGGIAMQLFQIALLRVLNAYGSVIGAANRSDWSLIFIYLAACLSTDKMEEILSEMGLSGGIKLNFSIGQNFKILGGKIIDKAAK